MVRSVPRKTRHAKKGEGEQASSLGSHYAIYCTCGATIEVGPVPTGEEAQDRAFALWERHLRGDDLNGGD